MALRSSILVAVPSLSVAAFTICALLGLVAATTRTAAAASFSAHYRILPDMSAPAAVQIADNILSWQLPNGGWSKSIDFKEGPWTPDRAKSVQTHAGLELGSIDNNTTTSEIAYLAYVYSATHQTKYKLGVVRGLDYLLAAQYPSGGWPQAFPERGNYSDQVTFNDDAMVHVLQLFQAIAGGAYPYDFIDKGYRLRVQAAFERGIAFILKAQIRVNGVLTAWCQQHDPVTDQPTNGRAYEHASIASAESVGIVELLMSLPEPSLDVKRSILGALNWFAATRLPDGRWARMVEIGTNRPIFSGRDGLIKYDIQQIEAERRDGYAWYGTWPQALLDQVSASGYWGRLKTELGSATG